MSYEGSNPSLPSLFTGNGGFKPPPRFSGWSRLNLRTTTGGNAAARVYRRNPLSRIPKFTLLGIRDLSKNPVQHFHGFPFAVREQVGVTQGHGQSLVAEIGLGTYIILICALPE